MKKLLVRVTSLLGVALLVATSGAGVYGGTVAADPTSYVAKVSLTLPDQSKLIQPQADIPISTNVAPNPNELS